LYEFLYQCFGFLSRVDTSFYFGLKHAVSFLFIFLKHFDFLGFFIKNLCFVKRGETLSVVSPLINYKLTTISFHLLDSHISLVNLQ